MYAWLKQYILVGSPYSIQNQIIPVSDIKVDSTAQKTISVSDSLFNI